MRIPKILIVDDEEDTRKTLNDYLSYRITCEIMEAPNGYEAIEVLQKNDIDLILLDIKMPGISGTEVIRKAKEISKEISIIVITKLDSSEISKQVTEAGAEYIPKPFSLRIIQSRVEDKLKAAGKLASKTFKI